jgi:hypothetical protein
VCGGGVGRGEEGTSFNEEVHMLSSLASSATVYDAYGVIHMRQDEPGSGRVQRTCDLVGFEFDTAGAQLPRCPKPVHLQTSFQLAFVVRPRNHQTGQQQRSDVAAIREMRNRRDKLGGMAVRRPKAGRLCVFPRGS